MEKHKKIPFLRRPMLRKVALMVAIKLVLIAGIVWWLFLSFPKAKADPFSDATISEQVHPAMCVAHT